MRLQYGYCGTQTTTKQLKGAGEVQRGRSRFRSASIGCALWPGRPHVLDSLPPENILQSRQDSGAACSRSYG